MCDGRTLASPLFRRLAGRGAFFFFFVSCFDGFYAWRFFFLFAVRRCMGLRPTLGRIVLVIVIAHAILKIKSAMKQCVLHFQGTIAFCLRTLRKTVLFFFLFLLVLLSLPRDCLLVVSRLLGLTLRPSAPVCVATGTL